MSHPRVEIVPKSHSHSRSSSIGSSASRSRSRGSVKDQALSMNLWGRGDYEKGDPGAHWGLMAYRQGEQQGDIFHLKQGTRDDLVYERGRRPLITPSLWGRSEVAYVSRSGRDRAARLLDEFGRESDNLDPKYSRCQVWGTDALGVLEREEIVPRGTSAYWKDNTGKSSPWIADRLKRDGRSWIRNPNAGARPSGPVDARFRERPSANRQPGRIDISKFERLLGGDR